MRLRNVSCDESKTGTRAKGWIGEQKHIHVQLESIRLILTLPVCVEHLCVWSTLCQMAERPRLKKKCRSRWQQQTLERKEGGRVYYSVVMATCRAFPFAFFPFRHSKSLKSLKWRIRKRLRRDGACNKLGFCGESSFTHTIIPLYWQSAKPSAAWLKPDLIHRMVLILIRLTGRKTNSDVYMSCYNEIMGRHVSKFHNTPPLDRLKCVTGSRKKKPRQQGRNT